jgi:16S rRNA (guanine527-N7)-methyltransferase
MLDVGSGAGFRALPLKIYIPNLIITLLEANSKKVSFLRHVIRLLRLKQIDVIQGRIEKDNCRLPQGGFPLITARALAGLGQTLTWCAPYLCQGGLLVSFLGPRVNEVLKENREIMQSKGIVLHEMIPYFLPQKNTQRNTVIFKKI